MKEAVIAPPMPDIDRHITRKTEKLRISLLFVYNFFIAKYFLNSFQNESFYLAKIIPKLFSIDLMLRFHIMSCMDLPLMVPVPNNPRVQKLLNTA